MTHNAFGIVPAIKELRQRLGGDDAGLPDMEELPRVSSVRLPNPSIWPAHVRAEMERILRGEE